MHKSNEKNTNSSMSNGVDCGGSKHCKICESNNGRTLTLKKMSQMTNGSQIKNNPEGEAYASPNYETIKKYKTPKNLNNGCSCKCDHSKTGTTALSTRPMATFSPGYFGNTNQKESSTTTTTTTTSCWCKKANSTSYKVVCACETRPRSSTVSGRVVPTLKDQQQQQQQQRVFISNTVATVNPTNRINDFSNMYRRSNTKSYGGRPCNCKFPKTNSKDYCNAYRDCRQSSGSGWIVGDSRRYDFIPQQPRNSNDCSCFLTDRFYSSLCYYQPSKTQTQNAPKQICIECNIQHAPKNLDVDECDGKTVSGEISLIQQNHHNISHYARDVYAKELRYTEPKYENVLKIADTPKYANVEEINQKFGDRLGPEGENSEDEVQYENVPSNKKQRAIASRLFSASANNLYLVSSVDVKYRNSDCASISSPYSGGRSGTFPQYLQKEVKGSGLNSLQCVKSGSDVLRKSPNKTVELVRAKKEMCEVKQQRLWLAQDEFKHLNNVLSGLAVSRTSLCSSGSSGSARYDPELLRSDVALARERVARLRRELQQARAELTCTQQGVDTLHSVEQKMSTQQGCYNITEAQAIMTELRNIQKSLNSGEKEKAELMQSLAKLKDDLTRLQLGDLSPETSTLSIPQEKLSTASQTDLCTDLVPIGTRLAEMARMRLQYDESRKRIQQIQQQLADLEDKVQPGQAESDKDRLLVFQEKEQLLRELRSITPRTRSQQEMSDIQLQCKRLEQDLKNNFEMSSRCIADRLKLHEEKQFLLQQLRDALRSMTTLEFQLKNLSASTLSVSSSSSLGSLSTTSSKGSLSSGLSFTDIYGGPQCITAPLPMDKPIDMVDLHRRVERLLRGSSSGSGLATGSGSQPSLSPRSSLSSVSPSASPPTAPPPAYDLLSLNAPSLDRNHLEERLAELRANQNELSMDPLSLQGCVSSRLLYDAMKMGDRQDPPLSPISETPPPLTLDQEELLQSTSGALSGTPSSSGLNSRSVSAAVSDESVAGDSGVFEASCRSRDALSSTAPTELTAQVQIKLQYSQEEQTLYVGVQKIRNLQALSLKEDESVYIRALILPAVREAGAPLPVPLRLPLPLPAPALRAQTLRLQACRRHHCLGLVQVSLADFTCDTVSLKWYNILSLQGSERNESETIVSLPCREESSDESTLISSQTSTLTRNQGNDGISIPATLESPRSSDDEDEDDNENNVPDEESLLISINRDSFPDDRMSNPGFYLEQDEITPEDSVQGGKESIEENMLPLAITVEKETNTECNFCPEGAKRRIPPLLSVSDDRMSIKRSQTFSPTPQLAKNQYICRLNRSESDSSMPLYRRAANTGATFDRHSAVRRSLRRSRVPGLPGSVPSRTTASRTSHTPRTSLDLELDLRAQHHRLDTLQQEIAGLRDLKQKLEAARETRDSSVASWANEDQAFVQLIEETVANTVVGSTSNGTVGHTIERAERRAAKALQRTCRDIYRLRRTRAPRGKPDLITFKEKMAFFTRYHANIPTLPDEDDDNLAEHSTDTLKQSEQINRLSQILGELDCETADTPDFLNSLKERLEVDDSYLSDACGETSDIQVGYQVRRSGRFKNVVEKSQMLEDSTAFGKEKPLDISNNSNSDNNTESTECLRPQLVDDDNNVVLQPDDLVKQDMSNVNLECSGGVVKCDDENVNDNNGDKSKNTRYKYVVDRVFGVQV